MIDLHLHTRVSDGLDSPGDLVARCAAAGLTVFSVTDHDTIGGWDEAAAAAGALGLEFVPGVEITAVLDGRDVHILGYFGSRRAPVLESFLDGQRADRVRRVREMVGRLGTLGLPVDVELVLGAADPGRAVGRPQIADAMIAAGQIASRDEAFSRYLGYGCPAFVPRAGGTPEAVIELITAAGGVASLAHPALLDRDELIAGLILGGLAALEAYHPDHDPDTAARYHRLAVRSGLLVTGGSDFHGVNSGHRQSALGRITLPPAEFERLRAHLQQA